MSYTEQLSKDWGTSTRSKTFFSFRIIIYKGGVVSTRSFGPSLTEQNATIYHQVNHKYSTQIH
jgi:hypothetical protein